MTYKEESYILDTLIEIQETIRSPELSYHNNGTSNSKVIVSNCYFMRNKTIA